MPLKEYQKAAATWGTRELHEQKVKACRSIGGDIIISIVYPLTLLYLPLDVAGGGTSLEAIEVR
jgi:hypothetical protein